MLDPRKPDFLNTPASKQRPRGWFTPRDVASAVARPQVSIVTPFYNIGEIFHETARCVLGQTFSQFEWLIVNDKSTKPECLAILDQYRNIDPRVRVIDREVNGGLSAARNTGYAAARSDVVYQVDADDLAEPTYVEKCLWFLRTNPQFAFVKSYTTAFEGQCYSWFQGFEEGPRFLKENLVHVQALIRKSTWEAVGGFDETNRGGLEDWEFWLACAEKGLWGSTIPELLEWYRRRPNNQENWPNWCDPAKREAFVANLHKRYPRIFADAKHFPKPQRHWAGPYEQVPIKLPMTNPLARKSDDKRLLMVLPWMTMGGADRYNVRLVEQLVRRGWEVTIACTLAGDYSWLPDFAKLTSDIHILPNVARASEQPAYLRYLIESREPSVVLLTGSELGYRLLPYLRSVCPTPAYVDYCHIEEENWKNGGHPRSSAGAHDLLECAMVTSEHLKRWEIARGGDANKIEVVYINEDPGSFDISDTARREARVQLKIPQEARVVMFAGRITAQKQPHVLAGSIKRMFELLDKEKAQTAVGESAKVRGAPSTAHANASESAPDVFVLIAGDGHDRATVERELGGLCRQHGIHEPRVRMLGSVPASEMPTLYAASDLLFLPSQWEGISLAIYEAMAAGLAILGADVGGQKELVTPEVGVLLPRGTSEQEVQAYSRELVRMLRDGDVLRRMGKAARARIEANFALDAMGEQVQQILLRSVQRVRSDATRQSLLLPSRLAHEFATQAVEFARINGVAEQLWHECQTFGTHASRSGGQLASPQGETQQGAMMELSSIENSRAWRTVQGLKRNPLYGALATARWGSDWQLIEAKEPPEAKLARIKQSKAYRLIQSFKRSVLYRAYAKRKYG